MFLPYSAFSKVALENSIWLCFSGVISVSYVNRMIGALALALAISLVYLFSRWPVNSECDIRWKAYSVGTLWFVVVESFAVYLFSIMRMLGEVSTLSATKLDIAELPSLN